MPARWSVHVKPGPHETWTEQFILFFKERWFKLEGKFQTFAWYKRSSSAVFFFLKKCCSWDEFQWDYNFVLISASRHRSVTPVSWGVHIKRWGVSNAGFVEEQHKVTLSSRLLPFFFLFYFVTRDGSCNYWRVRTTGILTIVIHVGDQEWWAVITGNRVKLDAAN